MADMYAWSNFQAGYDDEKRQFTKKIKPGDEVSQADLDVDDEEWEALIASGAVREQEYPRAVAEGEYLDSPNKYFADQMAKAAEGQLTGDEVKELKSAGMMPQEAEEPAAPKGTGTATAAKK